MHDSVVKAKCKNVKPFFQTKTYNMSWFCHAPSFSLHFLFFLRWELNQALVLPPPSFGRVSPASFHPAHLSASTCNPEMEKASSNLHSLPDRCYLCGGSRGLFLRVVQLIVSRNLTLPSHLLTELSCMCVLDGSRTKH